MYDFSQYVFIYRVYMVLLVNEFSFQGFVSDILNIKRYDWLHTKKYKISVRTLKFVTKIYIQIIVDYGWKVCKVSKNYQYTNWNKHYIKVLYMMQTLCSICLPPSLSKLVKCWTWFRDSELCHIMAVRHRQPSWFGFYLFCQYIY